MYKTSIHTACTGYPTSNMKTGIKITTKTNNTMQKQDYAGLSRTFDAYFPDVKKLVEQTETFHNKLFTQQENSTYGFRPSNINLGQCRLIGTLEINQNDKNEAIPRLYFKKGAEGTNPYFYAIATPNLEILYVGSSLDDARPKTTSASVSAITGGVVPFIDSKQLYIVYLGILSAIKRYGHCMVYEIRTGYEKIELVGMDGVCMPKKDISKCFAGDVSLFLMSSLQAVPVINQLTMQLENPQKTRDDEIWNAVSTFKGMIRDMSPEAMKVLEQLRQTDKGDKPTDNQEITITTSGNDLVFKFKNHVELNNYNEYKVEKMKEMEKMVPPNAVILCQTGDTVNDKYRSYVTRKVRDGEYETITLTPSKQERLDRFERVIKENVGDKTIVEYGNIPIIGIKHTLSSYQLCSDGKESRITVRGNVGQSISDIGKLVFEIETLFNLDPKTTKVSLSF